jgi:hypothetical protein
MVAYQGTDTNRRDRMENVDLGIDVDEVVKAAGKLMKAVQRLEGGVSDVVDRRDVESLITPLDVASGQAFKFEIPGLTLYSDQSENVGRKRPPDEPDLGRGRYIRRDDSVLAAQGRWALTMIVNAVINDHVRVVVDHERERGWRVEARNPWGAALLQIAEKLRLDQPVDLSPRRLKRCERCGIEFVARTTRGRFCSKSCMRAVNYAKKRNKREGTQ